MTNNLANNYREEAFNQVVRISKTLGNVSRLKLLENLTQGRKSVEELAKTVGLSTATASKNLQILKKVGLVEEKRDKNFIYYKLASDKIAQVISLLVDISQQNLAEFTELQTKLDQQGSNLVHLSIGDLKRKMVVGDPYIIDLRPADEYDAAHLPGAHNIPFDQFNSRMSEIPSNREIIVYCRGRLCGYSDILGKKLKDKGYQVQVFDRTVWEWNNSLIS